MESLFKPIQQACLGYGIGELSRLENHLKKKNISSHFLAAAKRLGC